MKDLINQDFSCWMQSLPLDVKSRPINRIALPGTHDSHSYIVDFRHPLGPGLPFALLNLAARISSKIAGIIRAWTLTQSLNIYEQLSLGCRSFDFRVNYDPRQNRFYLTHTFTCIPLETALNDLSDFLTRHPGEVVILQMKPGFFDRASMTAERNDEVIQQVESALAPFLCPATPECRFDDTMFLEKMVERNQRVLFYYKGERSKPYAFLWDHSNVEDPWDNTSDLKVKLSDLVHDLNKFQVSEKKLNMISFTLTPQKNDVIRDIFKRFLCRNYKGEGVVTMAEKMRAAIPEFFEKHQSLMRKATVYKINFPTPEFVERIISLNTNIY